MFAETLHTRSARHRMVYVVSYGAALRVEDLAQISGGTLLLQEAESLTAQAQEALGLYFETRAVPTARGPVPADVRIVAHAGLDLRLAVNREHFRADVLLGLAGVRLHAAATSGVR
jgi:DNA-binding NtrC family response regulator